MKHSLLYLLSSLALLAATAPALAQAASATFACPQEVNGRCFFAVFGPSFSGQIFEVRSGQSKQMPANVGQDTYCYGANVPPAGSCPRKPVVNGINR